MRNGKRKDRTDRIQKVAFLAALATLLLCFQVFGQSPPQALEGLLSEAKRLEGKQDYDAAVKIYQQALGTFQNQPELLKRLGTLY